MRPVNYVLGFAVQLFLIVSLCTRHTTGGCTNYRTSGYDIGVCISNMNGMAIPDIYVNTLPDPSDCEILVDVQDENADSFGTTHVDCGIGHKVIVPVGTFDAAITLHTVATLSTISTNVQSLIGTSPPVAIQATISLNYSYDYSIAHPPYADPELVLIYATTHFQALFPFPSCGDVISVGQTCNLGPGPINPIEVVDISRTSFSFLSLPGHAEGAGRVIMFSFFVDATNNDLDLGVFAKGPWSITAQVTVNTGAARALWQRYADNLKVAVAGLSPGR